MRGGSGARQVACWPWCAAMLSLIAGCSKGGDPERYTPSAEDARLALEQSLLAWQRGEPAGPVESPDLQLQVYVVDSHRVRDQKLVRFEILGEAPGEGPRTFAVKLHLTNPEEVQDVRYYVVGITPLWVFRREDYEMITHWEHPMESQDVVPAPAKSSLRGGWPRRHERGAEQARA